MRPCIVIMEKFVFLSVVFVTCFAVDNHDMHGVGGMSEMTPSMSMPDMVTGMDHIGHDDMHTMHDNDDMDTADDGHSGHTSNSNTGHGVYFFFSVDSIILFNDWVTSSWQTMLGSCFGVGALAAAYEGLKLFREYLKFSPPNSSKYNMNSYDKGTSTASSVCLHLLQVLLHMVQVALSYGLMMVFMTFNGWLCIAVIIGAGVGYLAFGWKMRHATDVLEHCN